MLKNLIVSVLSVALVATALPNIPGLSSLKGISLIEPAQAQRLRLRVPRGVRRPFRARPGRYYRGRRILPFRTFRRSLGFLAAVTVGAVILSDLSKSQRREVARRTRKVAESDPDSEVVDTYETSKGKKTVTIKAQPSQPAVAFREDSAIKGDGSAKGSQTKTASDADDTGGKNADKADNKPAKKKKDEDAGKLKIAKLPDDTPCRRVETELVTKGKKSDGSDTKTTSNSAILCKDKGKWKPAVL